MNKINNMTYNELMNAYENTNDVSVKASIRARLNSTLDELTAECQEIEERALYNNGTESTIHR